MLDIKPTIFISHIHENSELARLIKEFINKIFVDSFMIFVSSDEESIGLGDDWLQKIDNNLERCEVILLLCSPQSISRPWIAFEAGVGWSKKIKVIPLCYGLNINQLPLPFSRWQSKNINRRDSLNSLIKKLSNDFGLKYDELKCENIITEYSNRIKKLEQR